MEVIINQAILHVLDTTMMGPILSSSCMELTAEKLAYFTYHIEKLFASDDTSNCQLLQDSAFANELTHNEDFVDFSRRIAGVTFDFIHAHTAIPSADLAVIDFSCGGAPWLAVLKLNYKNGYIHFIENPDGAPVNSIVQQRTCLPAQSGKVEEGALIEIATGKMRLLEKKFDIDGKKEFYLSSVVFQCTQSLPDKKKLQVLQDVTTKAVQEHYAEEEHIEEQVALMIRNQAVDNTISVAAVKAQIQENFPLAEVPFDDAIEQAPIAIAETMTVSPAKIRRMESRSIKSENGVEIKIPTELMNSGEGVEFIHGGDGTISLLIKNVIL